MARATTKADLTSSANEQFNKMWKLIDSMTEGQQKAAFSEEMATAGKETHWSRDRNLRDVLVHLYEWHQLLLSWVKANLNGERKTFLPAPYNWKTYPAMNIVWMNIKNRIAARQEETAKNYSNLRKNFLHKQVSFNCSILPYRLYQMELLLLQSVIELQQLTFGITHLHQSL